MAKVLTERNIDTISCPGCKANIEIERENPTHRIVEHEHGDELRDKIDRLEKMLTDKPKPEEKKEPEIYVPPYIEKYKCKSCGDIHTNKKYEGPAVGKCDTCGEKSSKKSKGKCPYCKEGKIEPFDASEDSDIERYGQEDGEEE